jgi:ribonuclease D
VPTAPPLVTTSDELARVAETARAAGRLALDTEFVWERTYRPVLGVIQLATPDTCVIVDAVALPDLSALFPVLRDPTIPKVLHGGGQDLEIVALLMGEPMRGVVDTQVEAAFLGHGLQVGLGVILERVSRVKIRKDQTYTDWTRRPLKPEQLAYAQADVVHLLGLHDALRAELEQRGRLAWVEEELRALEAPERWTPTPDEERYRSVKSWQRLDPKELAVLREVAAWRERAARRANIRPQFVANDAVLTTLAGRPLLELDELRGVRGLSPGTVDRHGRALIAAMKAGVDCPPEQWPQRPPRVRRQAPPTGLAALLRAAVQAVADRDALAPEVIASSRDLEALVHVATGSKPDPDDEALHEPALLHGWRRRLVGDTLLAIARGEIAMRYDPKLREVVGEPVGPTTPRA